MSDDVTWSTEIRAMKDHLTGGDDLMTTVRASLYVDHILIELLTLPHSG